MSGKVLFSNSSSNDVYKGGVMIPAGESRHVDSRFLTAKKSVKKAEESAPALVDVLDQSVVQIVELLPNYSDEELADLRLAEDGGKTRSTLVMAFDKEILRREDHFRLYAELENVIAGDDVPAIMSMREKVSEHPDLVETAEKRLDKLDSVGGEGASNES